MAVKFRYGDISPRWLCGQTQLFPFDLSSVIVMLDNQSIIQTGRNIQPRLAQYILGCIYNMANKISPSQRCQMTLRITWISGHDKVVGNENAASEARKAAAGESSQMSALPEFLKTDTLPCSLAAAWQAFRTDMQYLWEKCWKRSPRYARLARIDDSLPMHTYLRDRAGLTWAQQSLIMQLRTGHMPLNKHLHQIRKALSPICPACHRADETAHHFLIKCQAHKHAQHGLRMILGRKSMSIKHLLGKSDTMEMLLDYVAATG